MPTRLLVHKFDPLVPAPGGIDTCIRGLLKYARASEHITVIGVAGRDGDERVGHWEEHDFGGRTFRFLPVVDLDPGNQVRRVPHAAQIAAGLSRYWRRIPEADVLQTHRADLGFVLGWPRARFARNHHYFIHTQESGILGRDSDSFWRWAGPVHRSIERAVVRRASDVTVFNPTYAASVSSWNPTARFSPTWWDPELIGADEVPRNAGEILWVGRFETPKRPLLALDTFEALSKTSASERWTMRMIGAGNLFEQVREEIVSRGLSGRVHLVGRQQPAEVARAMATADVLLMTSVPGYEGFPRVLVEGLASGLPVVATTGTDTGGLLDGTLNGINCKDEPQLLAAAVMRVESFDRAYVKKSVAHLVAPTVVDSIYGSKEELL